MIIDERDNNQMQIFFSYSSIEECLTSLHVMSNPDHHIDCSEWVKEKYQHLSPALKHEINFFGSEYANWFFIADLAGYVVVEAYPKKLSFEEQLKRMIALDDVTFAYLFFGFPAFDYSIDIIKSWISDPEKVNEVELGNQAQFFSVESVKYFISNISEIKGRLNWTIAQYWNQIFSQEWPMIEKLFNESVKREELIFQRRGAVNYINTLHSKLIANQERVVFQKNPEYSIELKKIKTLMIGFSVFSAPHLMGNVVGDMLSIVKNINFHALEVNKEIPEELSNIFYAGCDSTRLKIMKMLWNSESTTKEMSEVLGLSPSTVSLHLKVLRDYNLVETNKIKKYVYYRLKHVSFERLQDNLIQYFEY